MGRLIDADEVKKRYPIMENDFGMVINDRLHKNIDEIPTVDAIPREQIEQILSKIPNLAHYESPDGQDLVMVYDVMRLIKQTTDPLTQSLVSYCQKIVEDYEKEQTE